MTTKRRIVSSADTIEAKLRAEAELRDEEGRVEREAAALLKRAAADAAPKKRRRRSPVVRIPHRPLRTHPTQAPHAEIAASPMTAVAPRTRRGRPPSPDSKRAFVLSLPIELSATEVSERGTAAGHEISVGYVHTIRSRARLTSKRQPKAPQREFKQGAPTAPTRKAITTPSTDLDLRVLALMIEHGYDGVLSSMERIAERVRAIV